MPIDIILQIIITAAQLAPTLSGNNPTAEAIESAAEALGRIARDAIAAYEQVAGKPMDLDTLQPITPVE